ncbi:MAG: fibronectin type III domain-containing protein, partial [Actinobacteria bacterium]|nr:fibronectin type III domain-containing protein [Actinomycetota bacterium]
MSTAIGLLAAGLGPAYAAPAAVTATTSESPSLGTVRTGTTVSITVTMTANQQIVTGAGAVTMTNPTNGQSVSTPWTTVSSTCSSKTINANSTCTYTVRFNSSSKGNFAMRSTLNYTVSGSAASTYVDFSASAATTPGAVTGLTATVISTTSGRVSWNAPADNGNSAITGYRLNVTDNTTSATTDYFPGANALSYQLDNLTLGTSYALRIFPINSIGESLLTTAATFNFVLAAPTAPTNLTASAVRSSTLTLSWNAVSGFVDGYKVQVSTSGYSGDYTDVTSTTNTSVDLTNLQPETGYFFKVFAYNVSKDGSAAVVAVRMLDALPHAPTAVQIDSTSLTSITLSWTAPQEDVDGYVVSVSPDGQSWEDIGGPEGTQTEFTINGIEPDTYLFIQVRAFNAYGDGATSFPIPANTLSGLPNPVTGLQGWSIGETKVHLEWLAPAPALAEITGYRIQSRSITSSTDVTDWEDIDEVSAETTSFDITGLTPCITLPDSPPCPQTEYRVLSLTQFGPSTSAESVVADPFFLLAGEASDFEADSIAPGSVALTWSPAADGTGPVSGYTVYYSTDPNDLTCSASEQGGCALQAESYDTSDTTAIISGLEAGATYYFVVVTRMTSEAFGEVVGGASTSVSVSVPNDITVVSNVTISDVATRSFTVSWDAMPSWWSATTYTVEISSDGGTTWSVAATTEDTSATVADLASGASYSVQVIASDTFLTTDPSEPVDVTTVLEDAQALRATDSGENYVSLAWDAPTAPATVTGYRIEMRTVIDPGMVCIALAGFDCPGPSESSWQEVATVDASTTTWTRSDIKPCTVADVMTVIDAVLASDGAGFDALDCGSGTVVDDVNNLSISTQYRVIALNDTTEAAGSNVVDAVSTFILPGMVADVTSSVTASSEVTVTWSAAADGSSPTTGYVVYYSTDGNDLECQVTDLGGCDVGGTSVEASGTSAVVTGLDPGTTYYFVVVATMSSEAFGNVSGPVSSATNVDTPAPMDAPTNLLVDETSITFKSASVTWDAPSSGSGTITYTLQLSDDGGITWIDAATTTETSYRLSDLADGVNYSLRVVANDEFTQSEPSESVDFQTHSKAVPDVPTQTDWVLDGSTGTSSFDPGSSNGATHVRYQARVAADVPGGKDYGWRDCDIESLTCTFEDIMPGTQYRVILRVFADGGHVQGTWSRYSIPDLEVSTDVGPNIARGTDVTIEVNQLRPGIRARISYGSRIQF